MNAGQIILVVISGLGVLHGLFLSLFLWVWQKGNRVSNRILSLLLLVLSFRIGKSVFLEFAADLDVKLIFTGLGTLMAIGPLYYLYTNSILDKTFQLRRNHFLHFIPALGGICFGLWIQEEHMETLPKLLFFVLFIGYYMHYLVYLIISYRILSRHRKAGLNQDASSLLGLMFFGLLIIWLAYVLNLFDESVPYIVGPVLYSVVAYILSFIVIYQGYIQKIDHTKYKTNPVSDEQMGHIFSRVQQFLTEDKLYRDSELTLKSMSESLNVSTQVLSLVINQKSQSNFNSFINTYRIEESIRLFNDQSFSNQTIASIAFEVGFNSISSFNTAFKKVTGKTPQAHRNEVTE